MIARLLKVRPALTEVLSQLEWDSIQNSEWKQLESLHDILKPFACYTQIVSGETSTTISAVVPILMELQYHLEEVGCMVYNVLYTLEICGLICAAVEWLIFLRSPF